MMKQVLCPKCEARTIVAAQKPFCAKCGWNLEAARSAVKGEVVGMWVCIAAVGLLALFFTVRKGGEWGMAVSAAFMTCIVLGYYFLSLLPAQKTLRAAKKRFDSKIDEGKSGEQFGAGPIHQREVPPDWIFHASKPRSLRVRWHKVADRLVNRAFTGGAALAIFSVFFLATTRGDFLRARTAFLAIGLIFLFLLGFRIRQGFKTRRLLQGGEVAIGRVLSQERSGEWKRSSKITYEFEDRMGGVTSAMATDITESLYEGMPVVVFYQAEDVEEHVALCETFFGIVVEGVNSILDS
jgi:hypothetical protein